MLEDQLKPRKLQRNRSGLIYARWRRRRFPAFAQEEDLAKKLANPVASLISVPIQANYDENIGTNDDGSVWRINIQPVIPFSLNKARAFQVGAVDYICRFELWQGICCKGDLFGPIETKPFIESAAKNLEYRNSCSLKR